MKTVNKTELDFNTLCVVSQWKPAYAVTQIIINDDDEVYALNGSDAYKIDFVEQLKEVVDNTTGNQGWAMQVDGENVNHFTWLVNALYERDYIGLDNSENAYLLV